MKLQDALNILGLSGDSITIDDCRAAYRRASMKYHPDRNPGGLEMMKAVNAAWDTLQAWEWREGTVSAEEGKNTGYGDKLNDAINAVAGLDGVNLEVCGAWLWASGNTKPHKEVFKAAGYYWASKKHQWYFRPPEWKSSNRHGEWTIDEIREKYGSSEVKGRKQSKLDLEEV